MGQPKPLLLWRGATLLQHACQAARAGGADPIVVVAQDPHWLRQRAGDVGEVQWVSCPTAARGQSESLRTGLGAARSTSPQARAVLVTLVDQVGLEPQAVRRVMAATAERDADAWVADYGDQRSVPGHPVALGPPTWPLVDRLRGDIGARDILQGLGARLSWVALPSEWRPFACNTPDDYRRLLAQELSYHLPDQGSDSPGEVPE